jgi:hypothetical protein
MQHRRSIEMFWWNQREQLTIPFCSQKLIDQFPVAETEMIAAGKYFRLSRVIELELSKAGGTTS